MIPLSEHPVVNEQVYTEANTGVSVTKQEQITYNKWLAETVSAHRVTAFSFLLRLTP